jgi:shikimate kinase
VVWLRGDLRELHERARRAGERPMLAGRTLEQVEALYRAREPYYSRAHVSVDTTGLGPDAVVARLLAALRQGDVARV